MKFFKNPIIKMISRMSIYMFVFLLANPLFANNTFGQSLDKTKVSISLDNATVIEIFKIIENQTPFSFVYDNKIASKTELISFNSNNISVLKVLEKVSREARLKFKQVNRSISVNIVPKKEVVIIVPVLKEITGKVIDENGQPLPGANITVKGTSIGTTTDFEGNFTLEVEDNVKTIVVSFIGYKTVEIQIENQSNFNIQLEEDAAQLDAIVVTGYRKSLEEALSIKKNSTNNVDAIVSEDVAKFPQSNISEALQRVSGIQITRDGAGGVGNQVSIRGLPSEYTQVTLNGQAAPNATDTRSYNFNSLPAELFARTEVYKSPTAKIDEGGIGGTVNMVTKKPFELKDRIIVGSIEGIYNTQQQGGSTVTPKLSLTYGNKNDKFGFIAGVSYNKFFNTSEGYDIVRYRERSYDIDNDGTDDFTDVRVPLPRYISQGQEVERLSFNLATQFKVSDNFELLMDAVYTNNKQVETRYAPIWFLQGPDASAMTTDGNFLLSGTFEDVDLKLENQQQANDTDIFQLGLTGIWDLENDWKINANINFSSNNRDSERFRYYGLNTNTVTYSVVNDQKWFDIQTPTDLSDASQFTMDEARHYLWDNNDKITSGQIDFTKKTSEKFTLDFGAKYRSRTKDRTYFFNRVRNIDEPFAPVSMLLDDFLNNVDEATGPNEFLVHDWGKAKELYGDQIPFGKDFERIDAYYNITENIAASYAMGTLNLSKLKLNFGVRLVNTSLISKGVDVDEDTGDLSDREVKSSYTDFLPSINARYTLAKNLLLRGSYGRVMTRPSLGDLSAYREIDDVNLTISAKNPELEPFRANQYDLSLEWYPKAETLLSFGFFKKDIESFITSETVDVQLNGNTYQLSRPTNGNNATIKGLEIGYQQPFTFLPSPLDGLGIQANYTLSDSNFEEVVDLGTGETESYELPNNSKHSYNLVGYYEKYGFSLRYAYNYRSDYLRSKPVPEDGLKYRDSYGQTDISAGYKITENISVNLNILNAFNSKPYEYIFERKFQDNISVYGTTFQFGVRASF
ncbi:TonB-dependent receptor [Sabulilitoribacter arenilitoris]|uniref:TonB-dependent receptor n=1 Tax=Wocania arenilitoris TaxID=2044858 RepID=A0AAE3JP80_9FLAO|nr:TonB-dependent receptor [Wocania arenilitoris]MCF7567985.1 TonB-dependent receptor [Wocania arenilitoris]